MSLALRRQCASARGLMERVLRSGAPIAPEYPLVFDGRDAAAFVVDDEEGEARAACAIIERRLLVRGREVPAGLIGSVATDPRFRRRGLCTAVLERAEAELARRGALLAVLWADDRAYYEKRGWRAFGWEIDFHLPAALMERLPEPFGVRERSPSDDEQIHALYERHAERVARSLEETRSLLACPGMEVLVLERWGRIAGYSCLGRGADLRDVVHEWGGDAQALLALLREHLARRRERGEEQGLYLIAPPSAIDVAERLTLLGAALAQGVVGMGKIVRTDAAAELAARLCDRRGGASVVSTSADGAAVLRGPKGDATCTREELFDLLFAARAERTQVERVGELLGVPGVELPLTPFLWGLDSI